MLLECAPLQRLGVDESSAAIRFGASAERVDGAAPRRQLWLGERPAFELTPWCGTCPILFRRLEGATETVSIAEVQDSLASGLERIDDDIVTAFASLLPAGMYLPILLGVSPRLTYPVQDGDYFADEQVLTWGIDAFWGLPESPRTPYYRTFETPVRSDAHLYEFVVPMVPPTWNDRARVDAYARRLRHDQRATAVAVGTLDISVPAVASATDYHEHWALTHFLLDGHHKIEAAAATGRPLRLLSLVSIDASLADESDVTLLPTILAQAAGRRPPT